MQVHNFPPPSPPTNARLYSRTLNALHIKWDQPSSWGGCALDTYEVEYREIKKDEFRETKHAADWKVGFICNALGSRTYGTINANIYKAEVRVRAFNVGTRFASEWSEVLHVGTDKEEQEALSKIKITGSDAEMAAIEGAKAVKLSSQAESGMAVVVSTDLNTMLGVKHEMVGAKHMETNEWSEFRTKVGEFFVTAGVHGGCTGTLFDLTPTQVEDLVIGSAAADCLDEDKPLMSLAVCACWVLQTLAHHSNDPAMWIVFCNDIASLVRLCSSAPEEGSTEGMITSLLFALIDIFESLRQCEPSGLITQQLARQLELNQRPAAWPIASAAVNLPSDIAILTPV